MYPPNPICRHPFFGASADPQPPWTPQRIAKFDMHMHIDPDVAVPARAFLEAQGIGGGVNLSGGTPGEGLEETIAAARQTNGYFVVFVNIDFTGIGQSGLGRARGRAARAGQEDGRARGEDRQEPRPPSGFPDGRRVPVDDPVLDPLFDAMGRLHLPLAIHVGDPKAFFDPMGPNNERIEELASAPSWSFADRSKFPTWEALYDEFEGRVKRSSKTSIIGVHFGNAPEEPTACNRMLDKYPNFYVDTAARVPEIGRKPAEVRRVILSHPDHVLFGTDIQLGGGMLILGCGPARAVTRGRCRPFLLVDLGVFRDRPQGFAHPTPIQGNWTIDGIELPPDILEKIYHKNAERLLGLPATPVPPPPTRRPSTERSSEAAAQRISTPFKSAVMAGRKP